MQIYADDDVNAYWKNGKVYKVSVSNETGKCQRHLTLLTDSCTQIFLVCRKVLRAAIRPLDAWIILVGVERADWLACRKRLGSFHPVLHLPFVSSVYQAFSKPLEQLLEQVL